MGLVCRLVEERGIATVYVATGRDLAAQVKPPRTLFVNYPMGNNFGRPHDAAGQTAVLRAALALLDSSEAGVFVDYPVPWGEPFAYAPGGRVIGQAAP